MAGRARAGRRATGGDADRRQSGHGVAGRRQGGYRRGACRLATGRQAGVDSTGAGVGRCSRDGRRRHQRRAGTGCRRCWHRDGRRRQRHRAGDGRCGPDDGRPVAHSGGAANLAGDGPSNPAEPGDRAGHRRRAHPRARAVGPPGPLARRTAHPDTAHLDPVSVRGIGWRHRRTGWRRESHARGIHADRRVYRDAVDGDAAAQAA